MFEVLHFKKYLRTLTWTVNVFSIPWKGNRGMHSAYLIYSLSHPTCRHEYLGVCNLPTFLCMLIILFSERNLTNGSSMARRITDRILRLSSLLNIPRWNIHILAGLWPSRHHWWAEDMLVCAGKVLGKPRGPGEALVGLGISWWIWERHVGSGEAVVDLGKLW